MDSKTYLSLKEFYTTEVEKKQLTTFLRANAGKDVFVYLRSQKRWRAEIVHAHIFFDLRERCTSSPCLYPFEPLFTVI